MVSYLRTSILCICFMLFTCEEMIDIFPPTLEILEPESKSKVNSKFDLVLDVDDNIEVKEVEIKLENKGKEFYQITLNSSPWLTEINLENYNLDSDTFDVIIKAMDIHDNFNIEEIELYLFNGNTNSSNIIITSPSGDNITWNIGSQYTISWESENVGFVKVELYKYYSQILTINNNTFGNGSLLWNVPSDLVPAGDYNIKVTSVDDNYTFRYSDYFSIQDTQSPSITVLTPNGSESWATQSTYNIQWNSTQISGNIGIQLFRDSFEKTITLATANDGSFFWDIPNDLESADNYRVKIYSNNNSTINDFSDSRFSILNSSSAYISIISPNGGEEWLKGSTEQIAWSSNQVSGAVRIDLFKDNSGTLVQTISSSTSNLGNFSWIIPENLANDSTYTIRITSLAAPSVGDWSNESFTISDDISTSKEITVELPNGGEEWMFGESSVIEWSTSNIGIFETLGIDLYQGNSKVYAISTSTINDGTYTFSNNLATLLTEGDDYRIKFI